MKLILILIPVAAILFLSIKATTAIRPLLPTGTKSITELIQKSPIPSENDTDFPLSLPEGYRISIFAKDVPGARDIEEAPNGIFIVSLTGSGKIVGLIDSEKDGEADRVVTLAEKLKRPHGLAISCKESCKLYIAESNKVTVSDIDLESLKITNTKKIIDLPGGGGHFTRSLLIKDDVLYVSIGSSCNVCLEDDERRASILTSDLDGNNVSVFAKGLRNSVFLTTNPETGEIWATDMGRDLLGDNIPPDEINIIRKNTNYGWPTCYGKNIHDSSFDKNSYIRNPCMEPMEVPSTIDIPAHSAPLGLAFLDEKLLVAYHGSWNRSTPTGYKVVEFAKDSGEYKERDFITGWLKDGKALGRPVDILVAKDKNIYISDDKAGVVYKVSSLSQ